MGTIICQNCENTVGYFEDEKVSVLYATSHKCNGCETPSNKKTNE